MYTEYNASLVDFGSQQGLLQSFGVGGLFLYRTRSNGWLNAIYKQAIFPNITINTTVPLKSSLSRLIY